MQRSDRMVHGGHERDRLHPVRRRQRGPLAALVSDPALDGPLPVLLTADLNAAPDSREVLPLTDVMVDAWIAGGGGPDGVTLSSANPFAPLEAEKQIDQRIDYVLARPGIAGQGVSVQRAFVAGTAVDGLYPSDHYAVVTDVAVGESVAAAGDAIGLDGLDHFRTPLGEPDAHD